MAVKHRDSPPLVWTLNFASKLIMMLIMMSPQTPTRAMTTDQSGPEIRLLNDCTCIGYPLEFECVAIGPGATIWQGSALNCPSSLNKIQLYHSRFTSGRASGSCNSGNIVARALDTDGGRYRSLLNIHNLTPEMIGTTVECLYDNGTHIHSINNITIVVTTEVFPPPNISLSTVSKGNLSFTWNPVAPSCAAIQYNINADKCGRCITVTTSTSVTCTDVVVEDEELCSFGVATVVCSGTGPGVQNVLEIMLRVPNISASAIDVTPTYNNDTSSLTKLTTKFNTTENKNIMQHTVTSDAHDVINGSVISYTVNYTDVDSGESCGNGTLSPSTCTDGVCSHEFQVNSSMCPPETNYTIKMYGTNALGDGRDSDPIRRDFINHFVRITLNPSGRSISCEFVNQHGSDGMRTCSVTYFDEYCQEELLIMSGVTDSDHINLYYGDLLNMHTTYCYVIAASNGTLKVNISGTYLQQPELDKKPSASGTNEWIIAVATIFPAIVVIAVTVLGIITTICIHKPRGRRSISSVKEKKIK